MNKVFSFARKHWRYIVIALIALIIGTSTGPTDAEVESTHKELANAIQQLEEKDEALKEAISSNDSLKADKRQLEAKVKEAEPFFKLSEQERKEQAAIAKKKEEEQKAKEKAEADRKAAAAKAEAEKKEAAEKAAAAEEKRLAEEKEKKGYDTGITYDQLARTPDDFIAEKVKFTGTVVQVIEGDGITQIRLAVKDNYDTILFGEFDSSIIESRILEDDTITIMGISTGLLTYESTLGGEISIPGVSIEKID